jgi:DNA-binding FadR family transcriptional regulator
MKPQTPVVVPKLSAMVLKQLRREIATGELEPGANMPTEGELMERFSVSRATIREAMRVLETDGFVSTRRGLRYGATVSRPNGATSARVVAMMLRQQGATVGDVYTARIAVESYAARLLAESDNKDAVVQLAELVTAEREAVDDPQLWGTAVARFHRAVTELCGNITLGIMGLQLNEIAERQIKVEMRRTNKARQKKHLCQVDDMHDQLVELITAGDGDGAEALWREHLHSALPWHIHTHTVAIDELLEQDPSIDGNT